MLIKIAILLVVGSASAHIEVKGGLGLELGGPSNASAVGSAGGSPSLSSGGSTGVSAGGSFGLSIGVGSAVGLLGGLAGKLKAEADANLAKLNSALNNAANDTKVRLEAGQKAVQAIQQRLEAEVKELAQNKTKVVQQIGVQLEADVKQFREGIKTQLIAANEELQAKLAAATKMAIEANGDIKVKLETDIKQLKEKFAKLEDQLISSVSATINVAEAKVNDVIYDLKVTGAKISTSVQGKLGELQNALKEATTHVMENAAAIKVKLEAAAKEGGEKGAAIKANAVVQLKVEAQHLQDLQAKLNEAVQIVEAKLRNEAAEGVANAKAELATYVNGLKECGAKIGAQMAELQNIAANLNVDINVSVGAKTVASAGAGANAGTTGAGANGAISAPIAGTSGATGSASVPSVAANGGVGATIG